VQYGTFFVSGELVTPSGRFRPVGDNIMKAQMKHERVNMSYAGGRLILQNGKMRIYISVTSDKINLALGGKTQPNIIMDLDINS
jgi:hypothetical protein